MNWLRQRLSAGLAVIALIIGFAIVGSDVQARVAPKVTPKAIKENNRRLKYEISARCPQISGVTAAAGFNRRAERLVRQRIATFKRDIGTPERGSRARSLEINYSVSLVSDNLISVGFDAYFETGGAHPNSYSFVLNYDLQSGRELALGDLFKPNSGYLRVISDYCIRQLRNQVSDYDTLRDGAAPTTNNYNSWLITQRGLSVTFDSYQVASYAEGPKGVLVPYSVIKNYVGPSSPIANLVK